MSALLFEHLPEVHDEIAAADHLLLFLDFDGTVAPIVARPGEAAMPSETRAVLEAIAARRDITVAVISGRTLDDLRARVAMDVILAGNHGLEISGGGLEFREPEAQKRCIVMHRICEELRQSTRDIAGAEVEDKCLTGSVHFRNVSPAEVPRLAGLVHLAAAPYRSQFVIRPGNKVLEIVPCVRWNKGSAACWIIRQLRQRTRGSTCYCYIGDDVTDEDAFRELRDGITIQVGTKPATAARFCVADTAQVQEFLQWLSATRSSS